MNRIDHLFQTKPTGILSVYFTAGYPNLGDTAEIIRTLAARGTDLIEVGIPFSDPMADGETIQRSSHTALQNGMSLRILFNQLKDIRRDVSIPLILMGYLNPIMQYGIEAFCKRCAETGIDGVILPDLPLADYLRDYKPLADRYGLRFIMLITPETSEERIRLIDEHTAGVFSGRDAALLRAYQCNGIAQSPAHRFRNIESPNVTGCTATCRRSDCRQRIHPGARPSPHDSGSGRNALPDPGFVIPAGPDDAALQTRFHWHAGLSETGIG